jgi:sterol desaturase/sphingolipid hydroxylase (fatty acid hydroxylase superfamily)
MDLITASLPVALLLSVAISLCIAAGLVIAMEEWRWLKERGLLSAEKKQEMLRSLSMLPPNIGVSLAMTPVWVGIYAAAGQYALAHLEVSVLTALLAFLAADLSYYWEHRCAHKTSWLWRLYHGQHHSSPDYTIATAYRVCFLNQLIAPAFYLPAVLLGLPPMLVLGFNLVCFHYQAWVHTEMIGPSPVWDGIFNTPANHRMHHSSASQHRDKNFGAVLMLWDKIFGTYAAPESALHYGIAGEANPKRWFDIYVSQWFGGKVKR